MVTLKQVSEATGVSVASVSKALNHLPGVSEEKARLVRKVAREMGYVPNSAAQSLRTKRSHNIGLIYRNEKAREYYADVLDSVRATAEERGYDITLLGDGGPEGLGYYVHAERRKCDGIILMHGDYRPFDLERLTAGTLPVVTFEQRLEGRTVVSNDNRGSMGMVVESLHRRGHRRIAFIHGDDSVVTRARIHGFNHTCQALGVEPILREGRYQNPNEAARITCELVSLSERPTCIIYPDDLSYLGGAAEIERHGFRIPDDISCLGYDGSRMSSLLHPALTSYRQASEELGRLIVDDLIEAIERPDTYEAKTLVKMGSIQEGESVRDLTA